MEWVTDCLLETLSDMVYQYLLKVLPGTTCTCTISRLVPVEVPGGTRWYQYHRPPPVGTY